MTTDGIAVIVTLIAVGAGLLGFLRWLANSDRRRAEMTEEEYENRERSPNLLGAGAMALDQMIRSDLKNAIEYQQDAEQGHAPSTKQQGEELPEPEGDRRNSNSAKNNDQ
jgi:hypothetical protein